MKNKKFDAKKQFRHYLKTVKLDEKKMSPQQYEELSRAFGAGASQILIYVIKGLNSLSDEEVVEMIEDIVNQLGKFWAQYYPEKFN